MNVQPDDQPATPAFLEGETVLRSGETADRELLRLREENAELKWRVRELEAEAAFGRESRRAALNLMEDALVARRAMEAMNRELTREIADRKRVEAVLRESQERVHRALAIQTVGVLFFRLDGRIADANPAYQRMTGFTREELIVKVRWHALTAEPFMELTLRSARELAERGLAAPYEKEMIRKDGTRWWALCAPTRLSGSGDASECVEFVIDITQQKATQSAFIASQERLRLIFESAVEHAIITTDLERRVTSWSKGAERMLGFSREEMLGASSDIIMTPEDRAAGAADREAMDALKQGRAADERWHLRSDGRRFWANGVMLPMFERPGEPATGFLKIFRDETEKREAQEALEASRQELLAALRETDKARAEAEAATRAKDHFLAVLSHELRTPLMPVMMAASTLARRKDIPETIREALTMIRRNVQLEAQLVDDLLDVTRIVHGKMQLMRTAMDLHEAIQRAVEITRPEIEAKKQELRLELLATEHRLTGDPTRLQQVVWNLIKNASKFSPENARICVVTRNEDGRLIVEVSDNGIGIEAEALTRIFDAFTQANSGISREFGGLGLGLSISRATVDAHGGQLSAESPGRGEGATFRIALPLSSGERPGDG